jgi:hypothetical protein
MPQMMMKPAFHFAGIGIFLEYSPKPNNDSSFSFTQKKNCSLRKVFFFFFFVFFFGGKIWAFLKINIKFVLKQAFGCLL